MNQWITRSQNGDAAKGGALMLGLFARDVFLKPMGTKLYFYLAHDEAVIDAFLDRFNDALAEMGV